MRGSLRKGRGFTHEVKYKFIMAVPWRERGILWVMLAVYYTKVNL